MSLETTHALSSCWQVWRRPDGRFFATVSHLTGNGAQMKKERDFLARAEEAAIAEKGLNPKAEDSGGAHAARCA